MDNKYLGHWLKQRLITTLGMHPARGTTQGYIATQVGNTQVGSAMLVASMGKGLAMGLKAWGPLKPDSRMQDQMADKENKARYSKEDIAALRG